MGVICLHQYSLRFPKQMQSIVLSMVLGKNDILLEMLKKTKQLCCKHQFRMIVIKYDNITSGQ